MLDSKGLLLFDYDGTLVDGSIGIHEVSERTVKALQTARKNSQSTSDCTSQWLSDHSRLRTEHFYGRTDEIFI